MATKKTLKFIDLFAGIGGIRLGFEQACAKRGIPTKCVFTSEIKPHAISILNQNHPDEIVHGDITKIDTKDIPDFDILLGGFPCQAFSAAGKRLGFEDTRGTLFFDVERILKDKNPKGFVLENVEGLVNHDRENKTDKIGRTLRIILEHLAALGYKVTWRVLDAKYFGIPQDRKRIYIVGTKTDFPDLDNFPIVHSTLEDVLETGLPLHDSKFTRLLLSQFTVDELLGKSIKDKRGGPDNIHSWDIEYKGHITGDQKELLSKMLTERRKKKWAEDYGIDWMDGMPLTIEHIKTFYQPDKIVDLKGMLEDLVEKKYLRYEHPKKLVGRIRVPDETLPKGYNIVSGKMSFEVNKVLDPRNISPTLVAMDMEHLFVPDKNGKVEGIRHISLREGLRMFGYPDTYKFDIGVNDGYDLLGNTVVVTVIEQVSNRLLDILTSTRMVK